MRALLSGFGVFDDDDNDDAHDNCPMAITMSSVFLHNPLLKKTTNQSSNAFLHHHRRRDIVQLHTTPWLPPY